MSGNGTMPGKSNARVGSNKGKGQQKGKGKGKKAQVGESGKRHQVVYAYASVPGYSQYGAHTLQQYRQEIPTIESNNPSVSNVNFLKCDAGSKCLVTTADRTSCV